MRRTLPLLAVLLACGIGVGCGTTAATGPQPVAAVEQLDTTTDTTGEPTARTYLAAPPTQPATGSAAPSSPAAPAATTEPASAAVTTPSALSSPVPAEAAAPAAVTPQPVQIAAPADEPAEPITEPAGQDQPAGQDRPAADICPLTVAELVDAGFTAEYAVQVLADECAR